MNTLTKWNPFKEMEDLQNRLSTLFGRAPVRRGNGEEEFITMTEWAHLVDITEDDKEYLTHPARRGGGRQGERGVQGRRAQDALAQARTGQTQTIEVKVA